MLQRCAALTLSLMAGSLLAFPVDLSEPPAGHPPLTPRDGAVVPINPPPMIWRVDETAASYTLELSRDPGFAGEVVRVEGIDLPFYNHSETLAAGIWYWRYRVVRADGAVSDPGPARHFVIESAAVALPVPPTRAILESLPAHPRVFVTPATLEAFRARRLGPAAEAWDEIRHGAEQALTQTPRTVTLKPFPADPGKARKQVFFLGSDGQAQVPAGIGPSELNAAADRANLLSWAYLISGEQRYAEAARTWLLWLLPFRMDYHLARADRAAHDTVVYNYEYGLKNVALTYDRIIGVLSPAERAAVLEHVRYHGDNAYRWCRDALKLDVRYENSHGQQCMHALVTTTMAVMGDLDEADVWADWLIRQYVNRLAWGGDDGGYTEGQTYGHKFGMILEALAALRTATGIDVFRKPRLNNAGEFWLYCMALNTWWNHWGDVYPLLEPMRGNARDGAIAGLLAAMTGNRAVAWYSRTVVTPPAHIPFRYLAEPGPSPKPPIDVAQARLFPDVGQLAAYDRFYDHAGSRIFFRSSPWGSHSHSHCDQNGFVIHAGGEILACDAGYYTYSGDTYHQQFSTASVAHNTLLANGKGQPKSITAKGLVHSLFDSPRYCLFTGSAGTAYPEMLERFDRTVLFLRPNLWVMHDDVTAPAPTALTWLLNTFEPAEIDAARATLTVRQRDQRLSVRHLFPDGMEYTQGNERPVPMLTKSFCRYTEAFPQAWTLRAVTPPRQAEQILSVLEAHGADAAPALVQAEALSAGDCRGVRILTGGRRETVLFRPAAADASQQAAGLSFTGRVASVAVNEAERALSWMLADGTRLAQGETVLFTASTAVSAAAEYAPTAARSMAWVRHDGDTRVQLRLPERPGQVWTAPAQAPEQAARAAVAWADGVLSLDLKGRGTTVLWIDPARDLATAPAALTLTLADSRGSQSIAMETAVADNGDLVAFTTLMPATPGDYTLSAPGAEILVQDRWDPDLSRRGRDQVQARCCEGTELFIRFAPTATPEARAALLPDGAAAWVSVLRNGGFEAGIPAYPPRSWTISHPRRMGFSWPYWSQEQPRSGASALKFVRPEVAMSLIAQPMRLLVGGRYRLRFHAMGNASTVEVGVSGTRGARAAVKVEPSTEWRAYETELDLHPGYTQLTIAFGNGGEPDQVLWLDDIDLSRRVDGVAATQP
ncbi:MAG: DUF4962 domain-containing protein [Lentisphaerae bacterium]|nr:DUF4962 domain-containing protein [Lentisphaerota bacterium]